MVVVCGEALMDLFALGETAEGMTLEVLGAVDEQLGMAYLQALENLLQKVRFR